MATILVVDDELGIRALLSEILSDEGHTVELAENAAQARQVRELLRPDLVLLDIWMPDVDGVTLLKEWAAAGMLQMPVIMMSGHGTIDTAVEATKYGASAFLEKPITLQKLLRAVEQALVKPGARAVAAAAPGLRADPATYGPQELLNRMPHAPAAGVPGTGGAHGGGYGGGYGGPAPGAAVYGYGGMGGPSSGPAGYAGGTGGAAHHAGAAGLQGGHHAGMGANAAGLHGDGPQPEQSFDLDRPLREARDAFEKSYFEFHLAKEGGSMTRVAEKTGLERTHLYRKLKQLGVDLSRNKRSLA